MDVRRDLIRLKNVEYGLRGEVAVRLVAVAFGGLTLSVYMPGPVPWIWLALYFGAHALFYLFVRWRAANATPRDVHIAALLSLLPVAGFVWMPTWLMMQSDMAMVLPAVLALVCTAVFLIWRGDTNLIALIGQIAIMAVSQAVSLSYFVMQVDTTIARVVMAFCYAASIGYFALALLTSRKRHLLRREASERSAQARKMEAVGQLAGGVAHDFNNILTAIQGNLELYGALDQGPDKDEVVANAHSAALRAAQLVQHLLAYARHAPMQKAAQDIGAIFVSVEQLGSRLLPAPITLRHVLPDSPQQVIADENQLITALINLIVNARDAILDVGQIEMSAHLETVCQPRILSDGAKLAPGPYLRVAVTDSGTGIPQTDLHRIFEPFYTTKPVGEGSGLGLSMVSGFAQQSGGGVAVDSGDWGTAVSVFLPAQTTADA